MPRGSPRLFTQNAVPFVVPTAAAGFQGPGDIVSGAIAWYGLRGYSAAYAAPGNNPGIDVVDQATGLIITTINILSTGALDTAAIAALGYAVLVRKMYDQTGNGHHVGTVSVADTALPTYTTVSSLPAAFFVRANSTKLDNSPGTAYPATSQPFSVAYVAERTGTFTSLSGVWSADSANLECFFGNAVDTVRISGSGVFSDFFTAADNAFHAVQHLFSGTSSLAYVDGSQSTTTANIAGSISGSGNHFLGFDDSARGLDGYIREFGLWGSDTSANFAALDTNMRTYWGI